MVHSVIKGNIFAEVGGNIKSRRRPISHMARSEVLAIKWSPQHSYLWVNSWTYSTSLHVLHGRITAGEHMAHGGDLWLLFVVVGPVLPPSTSSGCMELSHGAWKCMIVIEQTQTKGQKTARWESCFSTEELLLKFTLVKLAFWIPYETICSVILAFIVVHASPCLLAPLMRFCSQSGFSCSTPF